MTPTTQQLLEQSPSRIGLLLGRAFAEFEEFGARYDYSTRLMIFGAAFAAIRLCFPRNRSEQLHHTRQRSHARRRTYASGCDTCSAIFNTAARVWLSLKRI
jgi:hypothetical protein